MRRGYMAILYGLSAAVAAPGVSDAAAEEQTAAPDDEDRIEATSKVEKKVEFTFTYSVRTHGVAKEAKPAKKGKAAKTPDPKAKTEGDGQAVETDRLVTATPEPPKPRVTIDVTGNKVKVSRLSILVNRTIDLGVTMDIHDREIRLSEFVKSQKDDIDVHFDTIDVVSVVGGLETGGYALIYTDVDGKEAYAGKIEIK
ncbi:MAG: hypothetical protein HY897_16690 [Deltaproteobacteria bacterium]|nr:hypothetical protein [Deltaproteobacteria bacterium]